MAQTSRNCSYRCPLKAEITGSNPVRATRPPGFFCPRIVRRHLMRVAQVIRSQSNATAGLRVRRNADSGILTPASWAAMTR